MLRKNELFHNDLKKKLKEGKKVIGGWCQVCSPITAEILAKTGPDFISIDMEHGAGGLETLIGQCQSALYHGVTPIARAPWNDFVMIKRMLDAGVYGLIIPYINSKEEAEAAVKACKYPPEGIRGLAGSTRSAGYGLDGMRYFKPVNDEILIFLQVETMTAVNNLDEILSVPGYDGIFIGPNDLSTSMGYLANPSEPKAQEVIRAVEKKVLEKGKFMATVANSAQDAMPLYERGYNLVIAFSDGATLSNTILSNVEYFRKAFPNG